MDTFIPKRELTSEQIEALRKALSRAEPYTDEEYQKQTDEWMFDCKDVDKILRMDATDAKKILEKYGLLDNK